MKIKGKKIINTDEASEFANTVRGQYIISQALVMASSELERYETDGDITRSEPSNKADMEFLLEAFPLYRIHEEAVWEEKDESNV